MSEKRYTSKVLSWKAEQGYGFIENPDGGNDLFLHINDIEGKQAPKAGDTVSYLLHVPERGCVHAANARLLKWHIQTLLAWKVILLVALTPFILSLVSAGRSGVPLVLYSCMSILCFFMYRDDKLRAQREQWRIPDSSMHLVQLLYGWPGALVAQKLYYHKARKKSFQGVLRFIIFVHLVGWIDYLALDHLMLNGVIVFLEWVSEK